MMRLSSYITAKNNYFSILLIAFLIPISAKTEVGLNVLTTQNGNHITADFLVHNFQNIAILQFDVNWDANNLRFDSLTDFTPFDHSLVSILTDLTWEGALSYSWAAVPAGGIDMTECDRILSLHFTLLGNSVSPILIGNDAITGIWDPSIPPNGSAAIPIEPLMPNLGCAIVGQVIGKIFIDSNNNCQFDSELGLEGWKVSLEKDNLYFFAATDENGSFTFYGSPGIYDVSLVLPQNNLWTTCQPQQTVTVVEGEQTTADFPAQALTDCPQLTVDIAAPFLRRCFESTYHVRYCNPGTITAEDAYVEVTLDPFLSAVSSSIPWTTVNGQTYTFPIGDVAVGQCGDFSLTVLVSCDAVLGQTHCTEAHIFPDEICQPVNPLWDGSILNVTGFCDGDSVRFTITNIGDDMDSPVPFIVIEDDMVNFSGSPIQLNAGGSFEVAVPANGATWRVEVENQPTNPFNGPTAASLEGCGVNGNGTFSLGFVTQFPQGDPSPFTDVDCQPNVASYDPNDKTGYPNGYCAAHYIESNTDITYRIRFQNTGTDTAFTVVVRDTFPLSLDPATVQPGAASHPYDFELMGNGVVQFSFPNIMLPDSNVNEMASHGFVDFTASQMAGNSNGTVIPNQAAIYFDFNSPVFTNTYTHTVANDFVQSAGTDGDLSVSGYVRTWYGAPVEGVEVTLVPTCPVYTDANGYYEFLELDTADYTLIAKKPNLDKQEGVTVLDFLILPKLVLFLTFDIIDFPYQYLATGLNSTGIGLGGVTTFDLVNFHKLVLGMETPSTANSWRFVDANYAFPNTTPPFNEVPPSTVSMNQLTEDAENLNMVAIKPGDILHESLLDSSIVKPHFYFKTNPMSNGEIVVEVKANGIYFLDGFQFGLNWNPDILEFERLDTASFGALFNGNIPGQLQLMTVAGDDVNLPDSTTLFKLVFHILGPIGSSTPIALDETLLPFQVVVEYWKLAGATMENTTITIEDPSLTTNFESNGFLLKISPNPAKSGQPIFIETTAEAAWHFDLQIFDTSGRLLRNWNREALSGTSTFKLQPSLEKGLYFLKITDENGLGQTLRLVIY